MKTKKLWPQACAEQTVQGVYKRRIFAGSSAKSPFAILLSAPLNAVLFSLCYPDAAAVVLNNKKSIAKYYDFAMGFGADGGIRTHVALLPN